MNVQRIVGFKWILKNEMMMAEECNNLNQARVVFSFDIVDDKGDIKVQTLECGIEEALALKAEMNHLVEMLN